MSDDVVSYLNPSLFFSKLRDQINSAKMEKMPPAQWLSFIKGLTGKGVKQAEIEDSAILVFLQENTQKSIAKADLLDEFDRRSITIKEVVLGRPEYQGSSHTGLGDTYHEILYIANTESANIEDRIEEIDFQMEELSFDMDRLLANPGLASKLEAERRSLLVDKPKAYDFNTPHFSQKIKGKHGKNILFHARIVISMKADGTKLFFIDEIQSDWGQMGRMRQWDKQQYRNRGEAVPTWRSGVAKGPWVTDTKLWAGLALRRVLQRAATTEGVSEVAWIRLAMRNGGGTDPRADDARRAVQAAQQVAANAAPAVEEDVDEHETDHYYCRLIPSLAESILGKTTRVTFDNVVNLADREFGALPGFKMTEEARAVLSKKLPLYSAANVLRKVPPVSDERLHGLLERGGKMLGNAAKIRFAANLVHLEDMTPRAGSYMNRALTLALNAADLDEALDHESYHCAHEMFLTQPERNAMILAFRGGTELNERVRAELIRSGQTLAAAQCDDPEEAASHGFALWNAGKLRFTAQEGSAATIFAKIKSVMVDVVRWLSGESLKHGLDTPQKIFESLHSGVLARRASSAPLVYEAREERQERTHAN